MPRAVRYLAPLLLLAVVTRCHDQGPDATPATIVVSPGTGTIVSGTTIALTAAVSNSGGRALQGPTVAWTSTDTSIATVSTTGVVTALHTGQTQITASIAQIQSLPVMITVTAGAATQLAIRTQPQGAGSGVALTTQPIIEIRDAAGNLVTTATSTVTATIATGGGVVTGSTATATGGVATFTALAVSGAAGDRTLSFNVSGLTPVTSSGFALGAGAPTTLVIRTEPTGAASGSVLRTQPVLEIEDDAGNLVSTSTATVAASVGAGGGSVTGATSVAVGGVASFSALALTGIAGNHTLTFSGTGLTSVVSDNFVLSPGNATALRLRTQPGGALSGQPFVTQPIVEITDGGGNIVPTSGILVTASIASGNGLLASTTATSVGGVAAFSALSVVGAAGQYILTFSGPI